MDENSLSEKIGNIFSDIKYIREFISDQKISEKENSSKIISLQEIVNRHEISLNNLLELHARPNLTAILNWRIAVISLIIIIFEFGITFLFLKH